MDEALANHMADSAVADPLAELEALVVLPQEAEADIPAARAEAFVMVVQAAENGEGKT